MKSLILVIGLACLTAGLVQNDLLRDNTGARIKRRSQCITHQTEAQTSSCTGPDGRIGICQPLLKCASLLTKLRQTPSDRDVISFLKLSNLICGRALFLICCPTTEVVQTTSLNPTETHEKIEAPALPNRCGLRPEHDKNVPYPIVGGRTSQLGDWPWIALIGYSNQPSELPFKCGGTLISNQHVLTAAHCVKSDLSFVRLGEHDLGLDNETTHIDVPVSKILKHQKFSRIDGRNDIALLYLATPVQFTEKINPICLPTTPQLMTRSFVDTSAHIAGWGRLAEGGKTATQLQQLQISVYENEVCKELYKKNDKLVTEAQFDETVICAGDIKGGKDSCEGDSGGPLMVDDRFGNEDRFVLIGVVSYGIGCARTETPGVYARVAKFLDWIQNGINNTL